MRSKYDSNNDSNKIYFNSNIIHRPDRKRSDDSKKIDFANFIWLRSISKINLLNTNWSEIDYELCI